MTLGHQFLYKEFGVVPRIGWQVDAFGYTKCCNFYIEYSSSAIIPKLFSEMGFDAHVIARIDHELKLNRSVNKQLEFIWRGSKNQGNVTEIFTHILPVSYCTPKFVYC